jgi:type II secretion system protein N
MQVPFANAFHTAGSAINRVTSPITSRLGRRGTTVLRYVGLALVGLVVFLFALQATFPYNRVKERAIEALSGQYEVTIGGVERGIMPGNVTFTDVSLRSRPSKPEEVPMVVTIKKIEIRLGLLALISQNISANLDLTIGTPKGYGHITGNLTLPKFGNGGVKLALNGSDIPGISLPLRSLLTLPVIGNLDFGIELDLPVTKNKMGRSATDWTKAEGTLDFSCPTGCTLGDGITKMKPLLKNRSNQVMVGDGIDFGKINITSLDIHAAFTPAVGDPDAHSSSYKAGKFEVTKFNVVSPDGELHVDFAMQMASTIDESVVTGCLRFKPSESLLKKEESKKTYGALSTTGAELRADGLFHIKLSNRFKDMKPLNADCGPNAPPEPTNPGVAGSHPMPTIPQPKPPGPGENRITPVLPPVINQGSGTIAPPPPPPPPGSEPPNGSAGSAGSAQQQQQPQGQQPQEGQAAGAGGSGSNQNEPPHLQ